MGGNATLASYGVPGANWDRPGDARRVRAAFGEHMAFLDACERMIPIGGYLFVHAGIRPGVALDRQDADDLIWIREPFLSSQADFGCKVVHGHTVVPAVEHHANRIAVDTGAVRSGVLSTVVLEDDRVGLLTARGRSLGRSAPASPAGAISGCAAGRVQPESRRRVSSPAHEISRTPGRPAGLWSVRDAGRACWTKARSNGSSAAAPGRSRSVQRALRADRAEALRRQPAVFSGIAATPGRGPGGIREGLAQCRALSARAGSAAELAGPLCPQRRDRPPADAKGADARHRRHGRPRRSARRRKRRTRRGRRPAAHRRCLELLPRSTPCARPMSRGTATTSWRGPSTCRSTPCGPGCVGR